jgi:hypothetical protein
MDMRTLIDDFFDAGERVGTEPGVPTVVEVLDTTKNEPA